MQDEPGAAEGGTQAEILPWPAPAELAALRRRLDSSARDLARGRHASGGRHVRALVSALARRRDWHHAANGSLTLARSLLKRGRPAEAQTTIAGAAEYAREARDTLCSVDAAVLAGVAWIDLARLDEAENALTAATAAAQSVADPRRLAVARLALARCLFWRGRYSEAYDTLTSIAVIEDPPIEIDVAAALSRVALGRGDLHAAVSGAARAASLGERSGDAASQARARHACALAYLSVGDRVAVEREVELCLHAARAARDPLRAIKARLIAAEAERRSVGVASTHAFLRRVRSLSAASLPPIIRVRLALLVDLASGARPAESVRRHGAAAELAGLVVFAPALSPTSAVRASESLDEVVEILKCCQAADDEASVLGEICARVRRRLGAAAVGFLAVGGGGAVLLAQHGRTRASPDIARRVAAAGQAIAPHCREDAVEAGAPVRYGGETIGVLVAHWTVGATPDAGLAAALLTMAATAAGPVCAAALLRQQERPGRALDDLLGGSAAMEAVRRSVERAAAAPFPVLIDGESGSGKELVARALHRRSPRRERPFCTINCAALPDDLIEAELFGHARGAFTGALADRPGVFEEAHTGTLFLDEVGELALRAQAKVLRTIQEGELRRVGENVSRRVDVRLVAATNRDLRAEVDAGRFRLDLLYRLDVIRISLPSLRERREDIPALVEHFWREAAARIGSRATLGAATAASLGRYDWPGNVRELQNVLAALAVRCPRRGVVPPSALPPAFGALPADPSWRLSDARRTFDEQFVKAALVRTGGHRGRAAAELGVSRQGLAKLMARLHIADLPGPTE
jgi:DNA-binding NtrC family response regulator/tetratricopeptide (TPR) repeat protein